MYLRKFKIHDFVSFWPSFFSVFVNSVYSGIVILSSGMWADQDSDDDDRPRFGGGGSRKNNLSTPMNFVSGGIKQGDKTYKPGEEVL